MCRGTYVIAVCPHCPNEIDISLVRNINIWCNEREVDKQVEKCSKIKARQPCNPDRSLFAPAIREIWLGRRDKDNRDMRLVSPCIIHKAREKIKGMRLDVDERDAQLLKNMRGRARKHPKVILRDTAGGKIREEREADHQFLRELGIDFKANLEYDTPRQREDAAHEDDSDTIWREEVEREYYGARGRPVSKGDVPPPYQP